MRLYFVKSISLLCAAGNPEIMSERERRFIVCPGLGDAHCLLGKMWQCPEGHPGKWPKSKQSSQTLRSPLLTSQPKLSVPPSPGPTVTTEKSRSLAILLQSLPISGPSSMQWTHSLQALHRERAWAGVDADSWTLLQVPLAESTQPRSWKLTSISQGVMLWAWNSTQDEMCRCERRRDTSDPVCLS